MWKFVRRAYEDGWYDKEPQQLFARMHSDAEFVNPAEAVEPGTRRGAAEIAKAFAAVSASSVAQSPLRAETFVHRPFVGPRDQAINRPVRT